MRLLQVIQLEIGILTCEYLNNLSCQILIRGKCMVTKQQPGLCAASQNHQNPAVNHKVHLGTQKCYEL